jgi:hypothetical protein
VLAAIDSDDFEAFERHRATLEQARGADVAACAEWQLIVGHLDWYALMHSADMADVASVERFEALLVDADAQCAELLAPLGAADKERSAVVDVCDRLTSALSAVLPVVFVATRRCMALLPARPKRAEAPLDDALRRVHVSARASLKARAAALGALARSLGDEVTRQRDALPTSRDALIADDDQSPLSDTPLATDDRFAPSFDSVLVAIGEAHKQSFDQLTSLALTFASLFKSIRL